MVEKATQRAEIVRTTHKVPVIIYDDFGDLPNGERDIHQIVVRQPGHRDRLIGETAPTFVFDGVQLPNIVFYPIERVWLQLLALREQRRANKGTVVFDAHN